MSFFRLLPSMNSMTMIRAAVFGLVNVVHAHGVGVLEPAGDHRFVFEPLDEELVG